MSSNDTETSLSSSYSSVDEGKLEDVGEKGSRSSQEIETLNSAKSKRDYWPLVFVIAECFTYLLVVILPYDGLPYGDGLACFKLPFQLLFAFPCLLFLVGFARFLWISFLCCCSKGTKMEPKKPRKIRLHITANVLAMLATAVVIFWAQLVSTVGACVGSAAVICCLDDLDVLMNGFWTGGPVGMLVLLILIVVIFFIGSRVCDYLLYSRQAFLPRKIEFVHLGFQVLLGLCCVVLLSIHVRDLTQPKTGYCCHEAANFPAESWYNYSEVTVTELCIPSYCSRCAHAIYSDWPESRCSSGWSRERPGHIPAQNCPCSGGRPYLGEKGELLLGEPRTSAESDWNCPSILAGSEDSEILSNDSKLEEASRTGREEIERWTQAGLFEQASAASFSVLALRLLSVAAPEALVREAFESALDELEHAKLCFGIASSQARVPISPGPYQPHNVRVSGNLAELVEDLALNGGVPELSSVLQSARILSENPNLEAQIRAFHLVVLADESRHASFAWRALRWCTEQEGVESVLESVAKRALSQVNGDSEATVWAVTELTCKILRYCPTNHGELRFNNAVEARIAALIVESALNNVQPKVIQERNIEK